MSKGIAVNTILMLLVGILVVGILVYLVYRYMISKPISEIDCRTLAISWCNSCKLVNFGRDTNARLGPSAPPELENCAKVHWPNNLPTDFNDCRYQDNVDTFCKEIAGIS
ncbi:MAG: hypothetical protein QMD36_01375 [Candidatus Aenigmarchaeota archaeon]|nr:hypothetical protein [Candidatus Aenigmarchaeota archaeon]